MHAERRRQLLLAIVVVVLAVTLYRLWDTAVTSGARVPASKGRATAATEGATAAGPSAPDVHLGALEEGRPKPSTAERDLFRFKPKAAPPPPPRPAQPVEPAPVPTGPPPPPPLAPVPFKFIGVLEAAGQPGKIAVLSDGRDVFHGREGDIIDGRYRILKIGVESIDMAYLDGRGRQTIRLSGQ